MTSTSRQDTTTVSQFATTTEPQSTSSASTTSSIQSTSTGVSETTSTQLLTQVLAPTSTSTTHSRTSTTRSSASGSKSTEPQASSLLTTVTRPITPIFVPTASLAAHKELPAVDFHLPFGAVAGIVLAAVIVIGVGGTCLIFGPRRTLRKIGIGRDRDNYDDYEEWDEAPRDSGVWTRRPASIGANSDLWKTSSGAFPSRYSTASVGGPGMAGVGAGKGMGMTEVSPNVLTHPPQPPSRRMSQHRVEERGPVRSGWFTASMVRGASLLSLGSLVRPLAEPSNGSERMSRLGTGGSAGRRFQELYRRERAQQSVGGANTNGSSQSKGGVGEMGERLPSGSGQHRDPVEMGRSRVMTPRVRRPSRLATSYVPEVVVHDTARPSLSSASHDGKGYDADAEIERRRVI